MTALRAAVQAGELDTAVKLLAERDANTVSMKAEDGFASTEVILMLGHARLYRFLEKRATR